MMSREWCQLKVSDHALVRFLARAGGLDVEGLCAHLTDSLARAHEVACGVGKRRYRVLADGLVYVVRNGEVVTVLPLRPRAKVAIDSELEDAGD